MSRERVRLALIGKGNWGKNYITTINAMDSCDLPANYIKTRDYPDLFNQTDIDGIIIATPISTHYEIAKAFLEKDFNLLIEKPITKTLAEAMKLLELSGQHKDTVAMVGHIQLYDPVYQEMKRQLHLIGSVKKLIYKGLQSPVRTDATVLEDWGPHPIYLFLDLVSKPISFHMGKKDGDNVHLDFEYQGGVTASADLGWTASLRKRELSIIGESGTLTFDWSGPVKKLSFRDKEGNETDIPFDTNRSPLELEVLEFVNCLETGKTPRTPLSQGVEVMRIIEEAQK